MQSDQELKISHRLDLFNSLLLVSEVIFPTFRQPTLATIGLSTYRFTFGALSRTPGPCWSSGSMNITPAASRALRHLCNVERRGSVSPFSNCFVVIAGTPDFSARSSRDQPTIARAARSRCGVSTPRVGMRRYSETTTSCRRRVASTSVLSSSVRSRIAGEER